MDSASDRDLEGLGASLPSWGARSLTEREVQLDGFLTASSAPSLCRTLWHQLSARPETLWLDLEGIKGADAVGLAVLLEAVRLAGKLGVALKILPSAALYRSFLASGIVDELPLYKATPGPIFLEDADAPPPLTVPAGVSRRRRGSSSDPRPGPNCPCSSTGLRTRCWIRW
jgi:ABC-type transporter Mla MlaB component